MQTDMNTVVVENGFISNGITNSHNEKTPEDYNQNSMLKKTVVDDGVEEQKSYCGVYTIDEVDANCFTEFTLSDINSLYNIKLDELKEELKRTSESYEKNYRTFDDKEKDDIEALNSFFQTYGLSIIKCDENFSKEKKIKQSIFEFDNKSAVNQEVDKVEFNFEHVIEYMDSDSYVKKQFDTLKIASEILKNTVPYGKDNLQDLRDDYEYIVDSEKINDHEDMKKASENLIVNYIEYYRIYYDFQNIVNKSVLWRNNAKDVIQNNKNLSEERKKVISNQLDICAGLNDIELNEYALYLYHWRQMCVTDNILDKVKEGDLNIFLLMNTYRSGTASRFFMNSELKYLNITPNSLNPMLYKLGFSKMRTKFVEKPCDESFIPKTPDTKNNLLKKTDKKRRRKDKNNEKRFSVAPYGTMTSDIPGNIDIGYAPDNRDLGVNYDRFTHIPSAWILRACLKKTWDYFLRAICSEYKDSNVSRNIAEDICENVLLCEPQGFVLAHETRKRKDDMKNQNQISKVNLRTYEYLKKRYISEGERSQNSNKKKTTFNTKEDPFSEFVRQIGDSGNVREKNEILNSVFPITLFRTGEIYGPMGFGKKAEPKRKTKNSSESNNILIRQVFPIKPSINLISKITGISFTLGGLYVDIFSKKFNFSDFLNDKRKCNEELCAYKDDYQGIFSVIGGSSMYLCLGLHSEKTIKMLKTCIYLKDLSKRMSTGFNKKKLDSNSILSNDQKSKKYTQKKKAIMEDNHEDFLIKSKIDPKDFRKFINDRNQKLKTILEDLPMTSIRIPSGYSCIFNLLNTFAILRTTKDESKAEYRGYDSSQKGFEERANRKNSNTLNSFFTPKNKKNEDPYKSMDWGDTELPFFGMFYHFTKNVNIQKYGLKNNDDVFENGKNRLKSFGERSIRKNWVNVTSFNGFSHNKTSLRKNEAHSAGNIPNLFGQLNESNIVISRSDINSTKEIQYFRIPDFLLSNNNVCSIYRICRELVSGYFPISFRNSSKRNTHEKYLYWNRSAKLSEEYIGIIMDKLKVMRYIKTSNFNLKGNLLELSEYLNSVVEDVELLNRSQTCLYGSRYLKYPPKYIRHKIINLDETNIGLGQIMQTNIDFTSEDYIFDVDVKNKDGSLNIYKRGDAYYIIPFGFENVDNNTRESLVILDVSSSSIDENRDIFNNPEIWEIEFGNCELDIPFYEKLSKENLNINQTMDNKIHYCEYLNYFNNIQNYYNDHTKFDFHEMASILTRNYKIALLNYQDDGPTDIDVNMVNGSASELLSLFVSYKLSSCLNSVFLDGIAISKYEYLKNSFNNIIICNDKNLNSMSKKSLLWIFQISNDIVNNMVNGCSDIPDYRDYFKNLIKLDDKKIVVTSRLNYVKKGKESLSNVNVMDEFIQHMNFQTTMANLLKSSYEDVISMFSQVQTQKDYLGNSNLSEGALPIVRDDNTDHIFECGVGRQCDVVAFNLDNVFGYEIENDILSDDTSFFEPI